MDSDVKQKLCDLITQPLIEAGCELAELVLSRYKNNVTLKLFIYGQEPVTHGKCVEVSRMVGELIDGTDLFEKGYLLEVSSSGLDRPLTAAVDFKYRQGEKVRLEYVDKKRKKLTAEIVGLFADEVEFVNQDGSFRVPLTEIEKAKIVF